jgi:RNA polymerase sigma factor (sigma-70 family)
MTDKDIIQSFLDNDQNSIRQAYYAWRMPFQQVIYARTRLDMDYMDDAYQEAFIRLQQHILTERLTKENIHSSLLSYLREIGYYVALEMINARREMPITLVQKTDTDDDAMIEETVSDEGEHLGASFDPMQQMDVQEREHVIRQLVEQIGQPCAPLLIGKLWENKSMTTLAAELGYSNADSAKAQKTKCMKKLIAWIKPKLIEYGYGY